MTIPMRKRSLKQIRIQIPRKKLLHLIRKIAMLPRETGTEVAKDLIWEAFLPWTAGRKATPQHIYFLV